MSLEGSWDFTKEYPFEMYFRVKFENATAQFSNGGLKLFADGCAEDAGLKKSELAVSGDGNISDPGGYYNELNILPNVRKKEKNPQKRGLRTRLKRSGL